LRLNADIARQRTEALRYAQAELEQVRRTASGDDYAALADRSDTVQGVNAQYELTRRVDADDAPASIKSAAVSVAWADRAGARQEVSLASRVSGVLPVYSALLAVAPQDRSVAPAGRWPSGARPLVDGRVAFKPDPAGTVAWLIDAASGDVAATCDVPAASTVSSLEGDALSRCQPARGRLLDGYVRYSLGDTPDPVTPNDTPLSMRPLLTLSPAPAQDPRCVVTLHDSGPERYLGYACLVPVPADGRAWSGRLVWIPDGWALGSDAHSRKTCRYTADLDGNGRIDLNEEHPARYLDVGGPLRQQNYLVVRGDVPCPSTLPTHNRPALVTVQDQP
jgi:hypothetical protein